MSEKIKSYFAGSRSVTVNIQSRVDLFEEMERQFEDRNVMFFKDLLSHKDSIVRTRAVCILADIAGENAIEPIGQVLKFDENPLVRHEAAFSLGQLGFTSGLLSLADAVKNDPSFFVRHEAAVAMGVIGSEEARPTLSQALSSDSSTEVRESAEVALANLDYIKATQSKSRFTRMTGG